VALCAEELSQRLDAVEEPRLVSRDLQLLADTQGIALGDAVRVAAEHEVARLRAAGAGGQLQPGALGDDVRESGCRGIRSLLDDDPRSRRQGKGTGSDGHGRGQGYKRKDHEQNLPCGARRNQGRRRSHAPFTRREFRYARIVATGVWVDHHRGATVTEFDRAPGPMTTDSVTREHSMTDAYFNAPLS